MIKLMYSYVCMYVMYCVQCSLSMEPTQNMILTIFIHKSGRLYKALHIIYVRIGIVFHEYSFTKVLSMYVHTYVHRSEDRNSVFNPQI